MKGWVFIPVLGLDPGEPGQMPLTLTTATTLYDCSCLEAHGDGFFFGDDGVFCDDLTQFVAVDRFPFH
jgi:hypothetical protein